ncbi:MAG: Penicillin amidase, partial [Solirubrobacterales bacterium]|nr:Penicillin amidase [Solirubrobacterales bacterium]
MARIRFALASLAIALALSAPARAAAPVQPYGTNDVRGFRDVLPPGTSGFDNAVELAAFLATGVRPAHNTDQRDMYGNLVYAAPNLQAQDISTYYKDSTFGVRPTDIERTYSPRSDVTIVRDDSFGVPHVYGTTRGGLMFGIGYATAEDRLFFIDVLRHLGRSELSSFAGGAPGNRAFDQQQWNVAPYTEADLERQIALGRQYGADGERIHQDVVSYVAGINAYVAQAKLDPLLMPGEYAALGRPLGPDPFRTSDVAAIASLVGGIFGRGGGNELGWTLTRQALQARLGGIEGNAAFLDFRDPADPEAPTTAAGRFP